MHGWGKKGQTRAGDQQALYFDGKQSLSEPARSTPRLVFLAQKCSENR